jgi:NTP pyrophosphatase (non-canonical NTP hydrolase)
LTNGSKAQRVSEYKLEDWIKIFGVIYGKADAERNASSLWLDAIEESSNLAEYIRREEYKKAIDKIPDVVGRFLSFVAKYSVNCTDELVQDEGIDLRPEVNTQLYITEWVLKKYPNACAVCAGNPCICPSSRYERERRNEDFQIQETISSRMKNYRTWENEIKGRTNSFSVEKLFDMFNDIYGGVQLDPPVSSICFHFLEEIGEVAQLLLSFDNIQIIKSGANGSYADNMKCLNCDLKNELSDVVSWIMALINKVNNIFRSTYPHYQCRTGQEKHMDQPFEHITLSHLLLARFYDVQTDEFVCPYCKSRECSTRCRQERLMKEMEIRMRREGDLMDELRRAINQERRKTPRRKVQIHTTLEGSDIDIVDLGKTNMGFLSNAKLSLNDEKNIIVNLDKVEESVTLRITRPTIADKKATGYQYFYGAEIVGRRSQGESAAA